MTYDDHRRIWPVHRVDCWWSIIPASFSAKRSCPQLRQIPKVQPHFTPLLTPVLTSPKHCTVFHCVALSCTVWVKIPMERLMRTGGEGTQAKGKPRQRRIQEDKDSKLSQNPIGICLLGFRSRGFNLWPITICPKPGRREIPHEIVRFQDNQLVLRPRRWSIEGNFPSLSKSPVQPSLVIGRVYLGASSDGCQQKYFWLNQRHFWSSSRQLTTKQILLFWMDDMVV